MKKKAIKWIKFVFKYLLPAVVGWLEGDQHAVSDALNSFLSLFF